MGAFTAACVVLCSGWIDACMHVYHMERFKKDAPNINGGHSCTGLFFLPLKLLKWNVVLYTCNPRTQEAEAGGSRTQHGLPSEILFQII